MSFLQLNDSLCQKHQTQAVAIDNANQSLLCVNCLIELTKVKTITPLTDIAFQQFKMKQNADLGNEINFDLRSTTNQKELCQCIVFNKNGTIMASGCDMDIKIWELNQGIMKEVTCLRGHTQNVTVLCFSKRVNKLFSGSQDTTVRLWMRGAQLEWKCAQVINAHSKRVLCIILNSVEDFLFTAAFDKTILVWSHQNNKYKMEQKIVQKGSTIYSISLNESSNKLAILSDINQITIMSCNDIKVWSVTQILAIDPKDLGFRLSFIDDDILLLQPAAVGNLIIFRQKQDLFEKSDQLQLKHATFDSESFPIIYNKQKQVVVVKHHKNVYFLKKQDDNFQIAQTKEFQSHCTYGTVSDNLNYLVVWTSEQYRVYENKEP